jgi:cytochrome b involved in lipid metabolism
MGIPVENLKKTFDEFNSYAKNNNDPWGLKFFKSAPYSADDSFHVAVITPVIHYTMGGLSINGKAQVLNEQAQPISGLFAAGEVTGGVHGKNRLGGSALLECVVYGREAGKSAYEFVNGATGAPASGNQGAITISIPQANGNPIVVTINGSGATSSPAASGVLATPSVGAGLTRLAKHDSKITTDGTTSGGSALPAASTTTTTTPATPAAEAPKANPNAEYTLAEVSKHNKDTDCWVVVNGKIIDATTFLSDHPGGKMAIMAFAGRDASEEFNMVHEAGVLEKFASNLVVGKLKATAKL